MYVFGENRITKLMIFHKPFLINQLRMTNGKTKSVTIILSKFYQKAEFIAENSSLNMHIYL